MRALFRFLWSRRPKRWEIVRTLRNGRMYHSSVTFTTKWGARRATDGINELEASFSASHRARIEANPYRPAKIERGILL